jgi:hypothetical protein
MLYLLKQRIPGRASLAAQPPHTSLAVPSSSASWLDIRSKHTNAVEVSDLLPHELDDADFRSIFSIDNELERTLTLLLSNVTPRYTHTKSAFLQAFLPGE